jgi:hypothetical protein
MKRILGSCLGICWLMSSGCGETTPQAPSSPLPEVATCNASDLARGCQAGACLVTAPTSALRNGTLTVRRIPTPPESSGDVLGDTLCSVELPADANDVIDLTLSITIDQQVDAKAMLFEHVASGGPDTLVTTSHAEGTRAVTGLVRHSGTYGPTLRPSTWGVEAIAGVDGGSGKDAATVLRQISSQSIGAAYFDGARLYVGSGNRLLIWNSMPSDASVPPDVVLGQVDLAHQVSGVSAAIWQGSVNGIWSNGTKLIASEGNRVLIWNRVPTESGTPADLVLGQPDFGTDAPNSGGISAQSLYQPMAVDSDGTRIIVSDTRNNRGLVWTTFPTSIGQAADVVIGQPDFSSGPPKGGATPIYQTYGALIDGSGAWLTGLFQGGAYRIGTISVNAAPAFNAIALYEPKVREDTNNLTSGIARLGNGLAVRDGWGYRVHVWRQQPTTTTPTDYVLGQPDPRRAVWSPTSSSTFASTALTMSGKGNVLLVPDGNRLLVFDTPAYDFAPAKLIVGQASASTNVAGVDYRQLSKRGTGAPSSVSAANGKLIVADGGNNRVLIFDQSALSSPSPVASVVLGQPDGASFAARAGANGMSAPGGVVYDGTHLAVADTGNHRILVWNGLPTQDGAPADVVLGQSDFAGHLPNHGRGDADLDGFSDADADGMFEPTGLTSDGTHLVVADRMNHRVLVWNAWPTSAGKAADAVIGQPNFTSVRPNHGGTAFVPAPDGFNLPLGVTLADGNLYVADTENNRVVRWSTPFTTPTADAWLGQSSGTSLANPNVAPPTDYLAGSPVTPATTASTVLRPYGVALANGRIFVAEVSSNRVHVLDATTFAHVAVLGQAGPTGTTPNAGGLGPSSISRPFGLAADGDSVFVADRDNNRVLRFDAKATDGAAANAVVGQSSMFANGFDQGGSASAGAVARARGVASSEGEVIVADTEDNRVLVFASPLAAAAKPKRVLGQADFNTVLPNGGGTAKGSSMFGPRGVAANAKWIAVADTRNHRVLLFDRASKATSAAIVLGQPDATSSSSNSPSAATLSAPEGVALDGERVLVADTGNHRVVIWTSPKTTGQPTDVVLGQSTMTEAQPNRGAHASAGSLLLPSAVGVVRGAVFVADTGNNRLLRWTQPASGVDADAVFGQPDFASRVGATSASDVGRLASPMAIATDDTFVYTVDRDLARVVAFAASSKSGSGADAAYGPLGGLNLAGPAGLTVEKTPFFTSRLIIGDTGSSRLVTVGGASRLR